MATYCFKTAFDILFFFKQQCEGSLMQFSIQSEQSVTVLHTVHQAVTEICRGLVASNSYLDSVYWNFKLASLSTWRTLASYRKLYPDEDHGTFTVPRNHVILSLPEWNCEFFFELIICNHWTEHILQVSMTFLLISVRYFTEIVSSSWGITFDGQ